MNALHEDLDRLLASRMKRNPDRERTIAPLLPLYHALEHGRFNLAPAFAIDAKETAVAIALAAGLPMAQTEIVAVSALRQESIAAIASSRLGDLLRDRHYTDLPRILGEQLLECLRIHVDAFDDRYEKAVWDAVWERLPSSFDGRRWHDVCYGVRMTLTAYLGTAFTSVEDARRFVPLIRLMTRTVVLGEIARTPNRWVIVAA